MSFRELRTFTETLRILGYPRDVSVDSFRIPNVELVADILYWLTKRYEPSAEIAFDIEREVDRVTFFRRCCDLILAKGRIKLNIKKIYQSDGYSVQELLKLAAVLRNALKARKMEEVDYSALQLQASQKSHQETKAIRQISSDLTNDGSSLFFLLEQEMSVRNERARILSRATEISEFERSLREMLQNIGQQVESLQRDTVVLNNNSTNLEQKIESKKTQYERAQKRLTSLMKVRPAFMEEYDRFDDELKQYFVTYLEHYRNLEYLEHELARLNKKEDDLVAEQLRKLNIIREKLHKEENVGAKNVPQKEDEDEDEDEDDVQALTKAAIVKAAAMNQQRKDHSRGDVKRPRAASGRERPPINGAENGDANISGATGNMRNAGEESEDSDILDDEDSEDDSDSDSDDDSDVSFDSDSDSDVSDDSSDSDS